MELFDVIVIGAGPGGYVAAIKAAQLGLKVACVEKQYLGGTCLNVGCIPSKALLQSSHHYSEAISSFGVHGIHMEKISFDFQKMMERKQSIVRSFTGGIKGLFQKNGVRLIEGSARFISSSEITVGSERYGAKHIIIATGSEVATLPSLPIDEVDIVSSTGALQFSAVPQKLIVIGAGVIGVELGSVYMRLGAECDVVEFLPRITPALDEGVSQALQKVLTKQGMRFHLGKKVVKAEKKNGQVTLFIENSEPMIADKVLVAIGRKPHTEGLGLEAAGIAVDSKGRIIVNGRFETSCPHIYAIGDVIDGPMLAHKASEEGVLVAEILSGISGGVDYMSIPNVVYTSPEVAGVGFTEEELKAKGRPYVASQFPFKANSRAKANGDDEGFVKLLADKATRKILGGHIIGPQAGELIQEVALAIKMRLGADDLANASHAHPTLCEAIKEAAMGLFHKPIHI